MRSDRQAHVVDAFAWVDDFAAARNHADSFLTTDWECWADADATGSNAAMLAALVGWAPAAAVVST